MHNTRWLWAVVAAAIVLPAAGGLGAELAYKDQMGKQLIADIGPTLKSYDPKTGAFGSGVWICQDQNVIYPLAVVWSLKRPDNPYAGDPKVLEAIMGGGDKLIAEAKPNGKWVFRKKDDSTWGDIYMPWTYSRWIRTFQIIREAMPPERRAKWEAALVKGYEGISKECLTSPHNIPAHHAMGLYIAGRTLNRPEWCKQAAEFMHKVVATQSEGGYWSEGAGPVVGYNFVYVEAVGIYAVASGDAKVMPALERAAGFHRNFAYPDYRRVETIDQRNGYSGGVLPGNVGLTLTPVGRAFLAGAFKVPGRPELPVDVLAAYLQYGQEGSIAELPSGGDAYILKDAGQEKAAVIRNGPWFICLSAYTTPVAKNRWHQDRQNLVSIWHERAGLVLGGGNTKLQPAWSNFTVGDTSLLSHKAGDENPDFLPKGELYHVPSAARLIKQPWGLDLTYGPSTCTIRVQPRGADKLLLALAATMETQLPIATHLTLLPRMGEELRPGRAPAVKLSTEPLEFSPEQLGGKLTYAGVTFTLPPEASLHWPALPHNPYVKDGKARAEEGRIEIRIPFDQRKASCDVEIAVAEK